MFREEGRWLGGGTEKGVRGVPTLEILEIYILVQNGF